MQQSRGMRNFRIMHLRILGWTLLTSLCISNVLGQDVDRRLQKLHWGGEDVSTFVWMITNEAETEREKLTLIYHWITHHIHYDYEALHAENWRINHNSADILTRGKALCWGYASLLQDFLHAVEIPSVIVSGYSRGLSTSRENPQEPDHAWNAVQIDTGWILVDLTWDSGLYHAGGGFDDNATSYFMMPPDEFVRTHVPAQPMWQLLPCPLTMDQFNDAIFRPDSTTCCSFSDSIASFLALNKWKQLQIAAESQYRFHPTEKNREDLCHANMDYAIYLKEQGDSLSAEAMDQDAVERYQSALSYFDEASSGIEPFDWQSEAHAFCHLNFAQSLYRIKETNTDLSDVISHLKEARSLLSQITTPSTMVKDAIRFIGQNLEILE